MSIIYKKIILIFLIYVYFMIIYVNITDRQTHQKYSLEPHKIFEATFWFVIKLESLPLKYSMSYD